jgi:hypothetical protein
MDKPQPKRTEDLIENLKSDILAVMPELEDIGPWYGSAGPRGLKDVGQAALRQIDDELLLDS